MSLTFDKLETPGGIGKFNGFLATKSYIQGYTPSKLDAHWFKEVSQSYGNGPESKFAHARRWFNHINSFSEEERSSWTDPAPEPEVKKAPQKEKEGSKKGANKKESKKVEHKKEEPKQEEHKKEEPKQEEHKKEEPKQEEHKKEEPKQEEHKKKEDDMDSLFDGDEEEPAAAAPPPKKGSTKTKSP